MRCLPQPVANPDAPEATSTPQSGSPACRTGPLPDPYRQMPVAVHRTMSSGNWPVACLQAFSPVAATRLRLNTEANSRCSGKCCPLPAVTGRWNMFLRNFRKFLQKPLRILANSNHRRIVYIPTRPSVKGALLLLQSWPPPSRFPARQPSARSAGTHLPPGEPGAAGNHYQPAAPSTPRKPPCRMHPWRKSFGFPADNRANPIAQEFHHHGGNFH